MALIGKPGLSALTYSEMSPEQQVSFAVHWIAASAEELHEEGGISVEIALHTAKAEYFSELKKERPFSARDSAILRNRRLRKFVQK